MPTQLKIVGKYGNLRTAATRAGESDEWYTPISLIRSLGEFDLDPACNPGCPNRTARRRYQRDGLLRPWIGRVWLNPPFSDVKPWVERMIDVSAETEERKRTLSHSPALPLSHSRRAARAA